MVLSPERMIWRKCLKSPVLSFKSDPFLKKILQLNTPLTSLDKKLMDLQAKAGF